MKFPTDSEGSEGHADARHRLEKARDHQRDMQDAHETAKDTPKETAAAAKLAAASDKTAAREAWVGWVERDY